MTLPIKTKIVRLALSVLALLVFTIAAAPFVLTWGINTDYGKQRIAFHLKEKAGILISPSQFSIKLLPRPGIQIKQLVLNPDQQTQITIDAVRLELNTRSLLDGKVSVQKVVLIGPDITTSHIGIPVGEPEDGKDFFSFLSHIRDSFKTLNFLPEHQKKIDVVIRNATSRYFDQFDANATLLREKEKLSVRISIEKLKLPLSELAGETATSYLDVGLLEIEKLSFKLTMEHFKSILGSGRLSGLTLRSSKDNQLIDIPEVNLSFGFSQSLQLITIEPMKMELPDATVGIKFVNDLTNNTCSLSFSGTDISVKQTREASLQLFKNLYVPKTLFGILLDGFVPEVKISLESDQLATLIDENKLLIAGSIQKGKVRIPETQLTASDIDGNVRLEKGVLLIDPVSGSLEATRILKGNMSVDLLNFKNIPFTGEFDLDADLSILPRVLIELLPKSFLTKELKKVSAVKGRCSTRLKLSLKPDSDIPEVEVRTQDFSLDGKYARIPGSIHLDNINAAFKDDILVLSRCSGKINGIHFKGTDATFRIFDIPEFEVHKGSATLLVDRIIPWILTYPQTRNALAPVTDGQGRIVVSDIRLSGPLFDPQKWQYQIQGIGQDIHFSTRKEEAQASGVSGSFLVTNGLKRFENLQATIHKLDFLSGQTDIASLSSISTPFTLVNGTAYADENHAFFNGDYKFQSGPKLHLGLKGKSLNSLKPVKATLDDTGISHAALTLKYLPEKTIFDFEGRLNIKSVFKLLRPESRFERQVKELTHGKPALVYIDANNVLNISFEYLDLDPVLKNPTSDLSFFESQMISKEIVTFSAKNLKIKDYTFSNVLAELDLNTKHSYIRLKNIQLCDIVSRGYITVKNKKIYADIPLKTRPDINIQNLLDCLFKKGEFIDGPAVFSCNLSANGLSVKNFSKHLNGNLVLNSKNGRIYKLTLLSRILAVLNVSEMFKGKIPDVTQQGFAYNEINITATIKKSVIHLDNAVIDGQDMTMIFSGTLDPVNDTLNLTCLVAPFKTVDNIIEKIPVINTLLGGRLVSVPVKAEGKLSDPTVTPLHPSAVGDSLVNMMSSILKSPVTLWKQLSKPDEDETSEP